MDIKQQFINGVRGFQSPQDTSNNPVNKFLDTIPLLRNIRGFNQGAFGQEAVDNPQVSWGLDTGMNMGALAEQEGKFGTPLRNSNPYQGSVDVPGLHQISIVQKGGDVIKRLYYNSLNDAQNAMKGIVVKDNQTALGPLKVMFKTP